MTVARAFALVFGIVYLAIGVLGFVKPLTDAPGDGFLHTGTSRLLGVFAVNWFHNLVHIGIGAAGLLAASRTRASRAYAGAIGLAYGGIFIAGLFTSDFLGVMPLNSADNLLHLGSAVVALAVGFLPFGLARLGDADAALTVRDEEPAGTRR